MQPATNIELDLTRWVSLVQADEGFQSQIFSLRGISNKSIEETIDLRPMLLK
jgi:hypothetical protein